MKQWEWMWNLGPGVMDTAAMVCCCEWNILVVGSSKRSIETTTNYKACPDHIYLIAGNVTAPEFI